VERALAATPGEAVGLTVAVKGRYVRAYVAYLDNLLSRSPKDATLRLKKFRPFLTKPREGVKVLREATTLAIVRALRSNGRGPIPIVVKTVQPKVTLANFGPVVVIRRESKKLYYYEGMRFKKRFGVATGQLSYPTPLGRFSIVVKQLNPWWYPPSSDWARGKSPVPPGPGNPLGTRWMGLSVPLVGIHGTPDPASIGYSASHGCIRMRIPDAEWLFNRIELGTTVFIVNA
jgi:lipoprotein-anchoring transpeptidase ErfK/SrfK